MDTLEKIFGSRDKVKIMRLFLFNPDTAFDVEDISKRSNSLRKNVGRELQVLFKANFIRKKSFTKITPVGNKVKRNGWVLNKQFTFIKHLKNFLINKETISDKEIIKRFSKVGHLKLIVLAGVFIQSDEVRVDLFLVVDRLNETALNRAIKSLEAELGKEIKYAVFDLAEFKYRLGMCDKLVRDVFDYPHRKILDRIGITD